MYLPYFLRFGGCSETSQGSKLPLKSKFTRSEISGKDHRFIFFDFPICHTFLIHCIKHQISAFLAIRRADSTIVYWASAKKMDVTTFHCASVSGRLAEVCAACLCTFVLWNKLDNHSHVPSTITCILFFILGFGLPGNFCSDKTGALSTARVRDCCEAVWC